MAVSPNINLYLYASVTLKSLEDGSSTKTFKFSNRPIIGNTSGTYLPLLAGVSDLDTQLDSIAVSRLTGSIRIIDDIGSFGADRKFSDFFERYTPIEQDVEIFIQATTLTDLNPTSFISVAKLRVSSYSREKGGNGSYITLSLDSRQIARRYINKIINQTDLNSLATNQNAGALGRVCPFIIGSAVEVKPILVSTYNSTSPETTVTWVHGTGLDNDFVCGGITAFYAKDALNKYVAVTTATTTTTVMHSYTTGGGSWLATDSAGYATDLDLSGHGTSYVSTRIDLKGRGTSNGAFNAQGNITLSVYAQDNDDTNLPPSDVLLGQSTIDSDTYETSFRGASDFWIRFDFPRPLVLNKNTDYYLVVSKKNNGGNDCNIVGNAVGSPPSWYKQDGGWYKELSGSYIKFHFQLYAVVLNDVGVTTSTSDPNGLRAEAFTASYNNSGGIDTDLTGIDWVVKVDGLTDDSGGSITGTPGEIIKYPHNVTELLSWYWDGAAWQYPVDFDPAAYTTDNSALFTSGAYHERYITGAFSELTTNEDALIEVCRNSACRLTRSNAGLIGMFPWGREQSEADTFGQDEFSLISVRSGDTTTIINHPKIRYAPSLIYTEPNTQIIQGTNDYTGLLEWYDGYSVLATELIGESEDLFGARYLREDTFPLIGDNTSAESVATFYLARYNTPDVTVTISLPLVSAPTLKLLDVIEITTPELPAYYASGPVQLPAEYDGYQIPAGEYDTPIAETYRAQTEGRRIRFDESKGPQLILNCRLLLNYPRDPT